MSDEIATDAVAQTHLESSVDAFAAKEVFVISTGDDGTETVMDLSMRKRTVNESTSKQPAESERLSGAGDAVKVELIPSAFEVKISELIINADKKNTEVNNEGGDNIAVTEQVKIKTHRHKRSKKRKQPPEKIIQGCKGSDYVITPTQSHDLPPTTEIVIEIADSDSIITKASNGGGGDTSVHVDTILEVETSKPVGVEKEEEYTSLPLKVPTVTVTNSEICAPVTAATDVSLQKQLQSSLFNSCILGSNSKPMRPFKLYTQNRDLLAGIGLNESNMNSFIAALSGRPIVSSTVVGSTASLPITAFAPLNVKNPLIPTTIPTGVPETTTISQVGSTAGNTTGKLLSGATSVITSTTTSSAMRLMTLATAADKILKGKKRGENGTSEKDHTNLNLILGVSEGSTAAVGHVNDDGTIELTLDATSPERLALIQQQIDMTASSDSDEPKSKKSKKRQQLPDTMKTPNYWERRRKNNEAAKRSRDARRAKEDQIAIRAAILEHENTRLKIELKALKEETAKLRAEIYERKKLDPK